MSSHDPSPSSSLRRSSATRSRSRKAPLIVLAAAIVVVLGLCLAFKGSQDMVQGMADADSIDISAKISARVQRLAVHEGDRVHAGQLMFELDSPEVRARQRQVTALLDAARAQADKAREGARSEEIRNAQAQWQRAVAGAELAETTYRRLNTLFQEGVVSRQQRDEAQAQADSATAARHAARAQYDQALAGARRQDQAAAFAQVRQAQGAVAEVEAAEAEILAHAPIAGEVGKRLADIGELVPAGYPIFTLIDVDHLWVSLNVREDQFTGLKIGDTLRGDIPALGGLSLAFKVYYIAAAGDYATWRATRQSSGYDVKSFEIRARPLTRVDGFRPGMSVLFPWPPQP
ncbi:MAG: hemolysin secretion protein D [Rhodanobacter denitrificans]|uniref:Hemolysin secretion protein D n=1 Tax=Rhodanobacter denitrificans TaxID=666685 RepID=A0A2W5KYS8_9GAMM|nr:MAG: hemolysin secretion protein D [Rhodanobacter denitrificans]